MFNELCECCVEEEKKSLLLKEILLQLIFVVESIKTGEALIVEEADRYKFLEDAPCLKMLHESVRAMALNE